MQNNPFQQFTGQQSQNAPGNGNQQGAVNNQWPAGGMNPMMMAAMMQMMQQQQQRPGAGMMVPQQPTATNRPSWLSAPSEQPAEETTPAGAQYRQFQLPQPPKSSSGRGSANSSTSSAATIPSTSPSLSQNSTQPLQQQPPQPMMQNMGMPGMNMQMMLAQAMGAPLLGALMQGMLPQQQPAMQPVNPMAALLQQLMPNTPLIPQTHSVAPAAPAAAIPGMIQLPPMDPAVAKQLLGGLLGQLQQTGQLPQDSLNQVQRLLQTVGTPPQQPTSPAVKEEEPIKNESKGKRGRSSGAISTPSSASGSGKTRSGVKTSAAEKSIVSKASAMSEVYIDSSSNDQSSVDAASDDENSTPNAGDCSLYATRGKEKPINDAKKTIPKEKEPTSRRSSSLRSQPDRKSSEPPVLTKQTMRMPKGAPSEDAPKGKAADSEDTPKGKAKDQTPKDLLAAKSAYSGTPKESPGGKSIRSGRQKSDLALKVEPDSETSQSKRSRQSAENARLKMVGSNDSSDPESPVKNKRSRSDSIGSTTVVKSEVRVGHDNTSPAAMVRKTPSEKKITTISGISGAMLNLPKCYVRLKRLVITRDRSGKIILPQDIIPAAKSKAKTASGKGAKVVAAAGNKTPLSTQRKSSIAIVDVFADSDVPQEEPTMCKVLQCLNEALDPQLRTMYMGRVDDNMEWLTLVGWKRDIYQCQCIFCPALYSMPKGVADHMKKDHPELAFAINKVKQPMGQQLFVKCRHCDYISVEITILWIHYEIYHGVPGILDCGTHPDIDLSAPANMRVMSLDDKVSASMTYICFDCSTVSDNSHQLSLHVLREHPDTLNYNGCFVKLLLIQRTDDVGSATYREAVHSPELAGVRKEVFICMLCRYSAFCPFLALTHNLTTHQRKQLLFCCIVRGCGFQCPSENEMTEHLTYRHRVSSTLVCSATVVDKAEIGGLEECPIQINRKASSTGDPKSASRAAARAISPLSFNDDDDSDDDFTIGSKKKKKATKSTKPKKAPAPVKPSPHGTRRTRKTMHNCDAELPEVQNAVVSSTEEKAAAAKQSESFASIPPAQNSLASTSSVLPPPPYNGTGETGILIAEITSVVEGSVIAGKSADTVATKIETDGEPPAMMVSAKQTAEESTIIDVSSVEVKQEIAATDTGSSECVVNTDTDEVTESVTDTVETNKILSKEVKVIAPFEEDVNTDVPLPGVVDKEQSTVKSEDEVVKSTSEGMSRDRVKEGEIRDLMKVNFDAAESKPEDIRFSTNTPNAITLGEDALIAGPESEGGLSQSEDGIMSDTTVDNNHVDREPEVNSADRNTNIKTVEEKRAISDVVTAPDDDGIEMECEDIDEPMVAML